MSRRPPCNAPAENHPVSPRPFKVSRSVDGGGKTLEIETDAHQSWPLPLALFFTAVFFALTLVLISLARDRDWVVFFLGLLVDVFVFAIPILLHFFGRRVIRITGTAGTTFVGIGPVGWRRRFAVTEKSRLRIGRLHDMGYTWDSRNNPPGILLRNGKKRLCIYRDNDDGLVRQVFRNLTDEFPSLAPKKRKTRSTHLCGINPPHD